MTAGGLPTLSHDANAGTLVAADQCYRCGYALRGIADDQACPECGLLARASRRTTGALHDTDPRWLRRLSAGTWLLLASVLLLPLSLFAHEIPYTFSRLTRTSPWGWPAVLHTRMAGLTAAAAVLAAGVWLLTAREGHDPADRPDRRQRVVLRLVALAPLLAMAILHFNVQMAFAAQQRSLSSIVREWTPADLAALAVAVVGIVPLPLLLFRRLRALAVRAGSAHLAEHCTIVGVGASLTLLYAASLITFMRVAAALNAIGVWRRQSSGPVVLLLLMIVAGLLFLLWTLYLLVRFAVSFGLSARRLRRAWPRRIGPPSRS